MEALKLGLDLRSTVVIPVIVLVFELIALWASLSISGFVEIWCFGGRPWVFIGALIFMNLSAVVALYFSSINLN